MPFPTEMRNWWMRVADGRCQYRFITEKSGLTQCRMDAEQVHHIYPESECIETGVNPNGTVGIPLCKYHHVGKGGGEPLDPNFSMHPDMYLALLLYREGNKDSFKQAASRHHELARNGQRVVDGDWSFDEFLAECMLDLAFRYVTEHPDDPMPRIKTCSKIMKQDKWYSVFD